MESLFINIAPIGNVYVTQSQSKFLLLIGGLFLNQKRVIITDPVHTDGKKLLKDAGFIVDERFGENPSVLKKLLKDYDVLIVRSATKATRDLIAESSLEVIGRAGVGLDNIDMEAAKECNITVLNTPNAPSVSVAELVIGLIIALFRNIPLADKGLKEGKWLKKELMGLELKEKTLGIVGFGNIGAEVAKRAKPFEMNILAFDVLDNALENAKRMNVEPLGPSKDALATLLTKSDVITLHVPLLPETYHMISEREFSFIKEGVYLINTSRGGVIDEKALLKALRSGKVAGAALDVFETEPPSDLELIKEPNVISTPHIGSTTKETQKNASVTLAQKIIDFYGSRYEFR
ncbi:MAG: hydroxyacid dehydrogenase [Promethearchaeota archaeon]